MNLILTNKFRHIGNKPQICFKTYRLPSLAKRYLLSIVLKQKS